MSDKPKLLGIDLGFTVVNSRKKEVYPDAFRVIHRFNRTWDGVFIVSRVNEEQKIRSLAWLKESRFFEQTGVPQDNLYYCAERKDKAPICAELGVTHFIDDRPEVMAALAPHIQKLLFNPIQFDVEKFRGQLVNTKIVTSWKEIEELWLLQGM